MKLAEKISEQNLATVRLNEAKTLRPRARPRPHVDISE